MWIDVYNSLPTTIYHRTPTIWALVLYYNIMNYNYLHFDKQAAQRYPVPRCGVRNCDQKIGEAAQVCNCDFDSAVEVTDCPNSLLHDSQLWAPAASKSEKFDFEH